VSASVAEIERELEATRAHAARTAEAIRYKLSPKQLTADFLGSQTARDLEQFLARALPVVAVGLTLWALARARRRRRVAAGHSSGW